MESITVAAIASTLIFKVLEKSGDKLGETVTKKIGKLISLIREKFQKKGIEGILAQAEESPTETNKKIFQAILETQVSQDKVFGDMLKNLVDEVSLDSEVKQVFLKNIGVSGSAEIGDISQVATSGSEVSQEAATNIRVGGDLKIGDVKQQG
jgi:Glu-tRNA(Gln) amidotransferase subunit E-like FAD-binding protein